MATRARFGTTILEPNLAPDWQVIDANHAKLEDAAKLTELTAHTGNTSNPHGTTAAQVGAIAASAGAVTDSHIGNRTVNDAAAALGSDSGTLGALLSELGRIIRAITGKANWRTAPATTLEAAASHIANASNPHSTTAAQVGAIPTTQKAAANGVASLDASSRVVQVAPVLLKGTLASRPAANTLTDGSAFVATDTSESFITDAGAWIPFGGSAGGGGGAGAWVRSVGS